MKTNRFRYQQVNCYTLQDVVEFFKEGAYSLYEEQFTFDDIITKTSFDTSLLPIYELVNQDYKPKAYIEELWSFIYPRFRDHYCLFSVEEITNSEALKFITDIVRRMNETYNRYSHLLKVYADKSNKLLDQISSSSNGVVRYNDTPQDYGTFDSDEHTTNLTESSSTGTTDSMTPIARIKEIQEAYKNTMLDWANEFGKFFLEEANIL